MQSFKEIFFPWVFLYLLARFLQGGGALPSDVSALDSCFTRPLFCSSAASMPATSGA